MLAEERNDDVADGTAAQQPSSSLVLPQLENGVMAIGDLWDARSASRPGFNIFAGHFASRHAHLSSTRIDRSEVTVFHNKDTASTLKDLKMDAALTAQLLGGFVKVTGGLEFERGEGKGHDTENFRWRYTRRVRAAYPDGGTKGGSEMGALRLHVDTHVAALVRKNRIAATHFVSRFVSGADATGSIDIRQSNHHTKYRVRAFLEGGVNLLIIKGKLSASGQMSQETSVSNNETVIKLKSAPAISRPPTDLAQFQQLMAEMDASVEIPVRFVLLPLNELLGPDLQPPLQAVADVPAESVEQVVEVLGKLRDMSGPDHVKRLVLERSGRLLKILGDFHHPLTLKIRERERQIADAAQSLQVRMQAAYARVSHAPENWASEMAPLLGAFEAKVFDSVALESDVVAWAEEGKRELELVCIDEGDEASPVRLFSGCHELATWLRTGRTAKLVLYCHSPHESKREGVESDTSRISNFPRAVQKLSTRLGSFGTEVGIAYPSSSSVSSSGLISLRFKSRVGDVLYEREEDVEFVIHVLEALLAHRDAGSKGRRALSVSLFNVFAEQLGLSLPLPSTQSTSSSAGMSIHNLPALVTFLSAAMRHISVYDSLGAFKGGAGDWRWRLVAALEASDSIKPALHALHLVRSKLGVLEGGREVELAICTFGVAAGESAGSAEHSDNDAPLLFIFDGGTPPSLRGLCVDLLDVFILLEEWEQGGGVRSWDPAMLAISRIASHSVAPPGRLHYAAKFCGRFEVKLLSNETMETMDSHCSDLRTPQRKTDCRCSLRIARSLLGEPDRDDGLAFPTVLVHVAIAQFRVAAEGAFERLLKKPSSGLKWWSPAQEHVVAWTDMANDLSRLLGELHPYLSLLVRAAELLQSLATHLTPGEEKTPKEKSEPPPKEIGEGSRTVVAAEPVAKEKAHADTRESKEESAPEPEPRHDEEAEEGGKDEGLVLEELAGHADCPQHLRDELKSFLDGTHHPSVLGSFLAQCVLEEKSQVLKSQGSTPFIIILNLMRLASEARNGASISREVEEAIVADFILALVKGGRVAGLVDDMEEELQLSLSSRSYFGLVSSLSSLVLSPTQRMLRKGLSKLGGSGSDDSRGEHVVSLLQTIFTHFHEHESDGDGRRRREESAFLAYLWRNERFLRVMMRHVSNPSVLAALASFQCKPPNKIPKFIPKPFIGPLKTLLAIDVAHQEGRDYDQDGGEEGDAYLSWEWPDLPAALDAWQTIWVRGSMPYSFPFALLRNIRTQPAFKEQLLCTVDAGSVNWDDEAGLFHEPWDIHTLHSIIQQCLGLQQTHESTPTVCDDETTGHSPPPVPRPGPPHEGMQAGGVQSSNIPETVQIANEIVRLVEIETVKSLKAQFAPLSGAQRARDSHSLVSHWLHPNNAPFASLMSLSLQLLSAEANNSQGSARGEGFAVLEEALQRLTVSSEGTRGLHRQRAKLIDLLAHPTGQDVTGSCRRELGAELRRTEWRLEHEWTLTVPHLLSQLIHAHRLAPSLLSGSAGEDELPRLLAHAILRGAPFELPTSFTELITEREEKWYTGLMTTLQTTRLLIVSVLSGVDGTTPNSGIERVLGVGVTQAGAPLSSLRLRLLPCDEGVREDVRRASGTHKDDHSSASSLLLVHAPALHHSLYEEDGGRSAGAEAERRLVSALIATSHLTLIDLPGNDRSPLSKVLQIALLNRLAFPEKSGVDGDSFTPPNLLPISPTQVVATPGQASNVDVLSVLKEVDSLASQYPMQSGVQQNPHSMFRVMRAKAALGDLYTGTSSLGSTSLHSRILHELTLTAIQHRGYSLRSWGEAVSTAWTLSSVAHSTITAFPSASAAQARFQLEAELRHIQVEIGKALEGHLKGYKGAVRELLKSSLFSVSVVRTSVWGWLTARLDPVYQSCTLGPPTPTPCALCRQVLQLEVNLIGHVSGEPQKESVVREALAEYMKRARRTAMERVEQVLLCERLRLSPEVESIRAAHADEFYACGSPELSWAQWLSTKNVVVPTWRRFYAELCSVYPPGFVSHHSASFSLHSPPNRTARVATLSTLLRARALIEEHEAYESGERLSPSGTRLLTTGVHALREQFLEASGNRNGEYCEGGVWLMQQNLTDLLTKVEKTSVPHRHFVQLRPLFAWEVHRLCLQLMWTALEEAERAEWGPGGRYTLSSYRQLESSTS